MLSFVFQSFRKHGINELLFVSDNEGGLGRAHLKDSKSLIQQGVIIVIGDYFMQQEPVKNKPNILGINL